MEIADVIGYIAGGIAMIAFLPQVVIAFRTKQTKDLSFSTYFLLTIQALLWILYGFMTKAGPIVVPNIAVFIASIFILVLKRKYG